MSHLPPTFSIRNLTSQPIILKLLERYDAPQLPPPQSAFSNVTSLFTNLTSSAAPPAPSSGQLEANAQSFVPLEVNVKIDPFASSDVEIKHLLELGEKAAHEKGQSGAVLRLTVDVGGEGYRVDEIAHGGKQKPPASTGTTGDTTRTSYPFKPLTPSPTHSLTAIHHSSSALSHVTILSTASLATWMAALPDSTPLSALSMPGTHNSATYHRALPSVRCQVVPVREQLRNGVRFLDVRVQLESATDESKGRLALVHSAFPVSLTGTRWLSGLLDEVAGFLEENPGETIVLSLKREGVGNGTDEMLSRVFKRHYVDAPKPRDGDNNPPKSKHASIKWYTSPSLPNLAQVRGKVVLMRRFALHDSLKSEHGGKGWAIDAQNWAYNTACDTHGAVCVQDFCEVLETVGIEEKIGLCEAHLARSSAAVLADMGVQSSAEGGSSAEQPLYLNFLSASNFWRVGCWPDRIAARTNPHVVRYLCVKHHCAGDAEGGDEKGCEGDGSTGIVVCDWVGENGDWDLVRCIVAMNSGLLWKQARKVGAA